MTQLVLAFDVPEVLEPPPLPAPEHTTAPCAYHLMLEAPIGFTCDSHLLDVCPACDPCTCVAQP